MDIASLLNLYRQGELAPAETIRNIYAQIRAAGDRPVWITLVDEQWNLARLAQLGQEDVSKLPLLGVPFAVKDNFDVAEMPTTAACPEFAFIAKETAEAVQRLLNAGAILIGKTNMDQFATGLVGTRTPYGICSSVFNPDYVSGGSSSGSAVSVASGLVSFSLGTDTAGSGRVPAAFNQLVGLKPTRGLVSTHGLLPACRSLDCVSVFAETCADAALVLSVLRGFDAKDAYSRTAKPGEGAAPWLAASFRFGVPTDESLEFFGDEKAAAVYAKSIEVMIALGGEKVLFDYNLFRDAATLLYNGPWVAERYAAVGGFAAQHANAMDPTVAGIVLGANQFSAADAFRGAYMLEEIRQKTKAVWDTVDVLLLPTAPTIHTIAAVQQAPVERNSELGYYTNFVNLLDLAAVAVPAGLREDGLPFGVSLIGEAFTDDALLMLGDRLHRSGSLKLGGSNRELASTPAIQACVQPPGCIMMAVVGAHLTGQPLNWQMTTRKARLVRSVRTHSDYRLFVLPNSTPAKPGLVYEPGFGGAGIELEVWAMPEDTVGTFLNGIPAPLSLGTVLLADGTSVKGFLCEPAGIHGAQEITHLGGWRAYLATLK